MLKIYEKKNTHTPKNENGDVMFIVHENETYFSFFKTIKQKRKRRVLYINQQQYELRHTTESRQCV